MPDDRYSKNIEEDKLFWQIVPHYNDAQNTITDAIKEEFKNNEDTPNILEIGCGTGITTQKILSAYPKINLTGIDNVDYIAEEAKKRLLEKREGRATILYADALEYLESQPDGSYDAIVSAMVIHNCPEDYREKVFKEIFRTLKNNGIFLNVDKIAQDDKEEHRKALNWQINEFKKFDDLGHSELKEKWTKHYLDDEKPGIILYEKDYLDTLKSIGFSEIKKLYRYQMEASYLAKK